MSPSFLNVCPLPSYQFLTKSFKKFSYQLQRSLRGGGCTGLNSITFNVTYWVKKGGLIVLCFMAAPNRLIKKEHASKSQMNVQSVNLLAAHESWVHGYFRKPAVTKTSKFFTTSTSAHLKSIVIVFFFKILLYCRSELTKGT